MASCTLPMWLPFFRYIFPFLFEKCIVHKHPPPPPENYFGTVKCKISFNKLFFNIDHILTDPDRYRRVPNFCALLWVRKYFFPIRSWITSPHPWASFIPDPQHCYWGTPLSGTSIDWWSKLCFFCVCRNPCGYKAGVHHLLRSDPQATLPAGGGGDEQHRRRR